MNGYIFLHKKIMETSFYKNPLATRLAVHLLLMVNHKDKKASIKYKETLIKRGQLLTGRLTLSRQTGISQQSIRTSLDFLRTIGFLTIESTNQYSIITIVKYNDYQITPTEPPANQPATNQQVTSNQPATNQQLTTTEELKELKELKELNKSTISQDLVSFECEYFQVSELFHKKMVGAYPELDILSEYVQMDSWLEANPAKRKKAYPRFINSWLARTAEKKRKSKPVIDDHYCPDL